MMSQSADKSVFTVSAIDRLLSQVNGDYSKKGDSMMIILIIWILSRLLSS